MSSTTSHQPTTINQQQSTNSEDVLVRVENVSKKFCRSLKKSLWYGVKDMAAELTGRGSHSEKLRTDEFWAVNDVSFELKRGECLGLIGHNGAGKTTLLKMLNGLIKPDVGSITMRGRVGALIALGAGFNPILSGRENIYVNASILGITKVEIDEQLSEIIDFAELSEFIDAPVQSYSSGMQVRLGFAVATALKPDVLILDEVLAVGDAAFRAKCFKRIGDIAQNSAIIFVSHDQSQISRICTGALVLDRGKEIFQGEVEKSIIRYNSIDDSRKGIGATIHLANDVESFNIRPITDDAVTAGDPLQIRIQVRSRRSLPTGIGIVNFIDNNGLTAGQANFSSQLALIPSGESTIILNLDRIDLATGRYTLNLAIFGKNPRETLLHAVNCAEVNVRGLPYLWCAYKIPVISVNVT